MILNLLEGSPAEMKYLELSRGFRTFIRLEWTLLEVHRAGMDFTGDSPGCYETREVHRAGMDFTGASPGWNGIYWRFTGLEWNLPENHRAVTKRGKFTGLEWILREIHRAGMDLTGDSPGWNDFHRKYTG
jgi:hypothetical protein